MKLVFATFNKAKLRSLQRELKLYNINIRQKAIVLPEIRSNNVREVAKVKVEAAYQRIKSSTIVIDGGFYINSLNGFPGTFVNFTLATIGLSGLLRLVQNKSRDCEFRTCLAYLDDKIKRPKLFGAIIKGKLANQARGKLQTYHWSSLALIFIPQEFAKTLGEMSLREYQQWEASLSSSSAGGQFYKWLSSKGLV